MSITVRFYCIMVAFFLTNLLLFDLWGEIRDLKEEVYEIKRKGEKNDGRLLELGYK